MKLKYSKIEQEKAPFSSVDSFRWNLLVVFVDFEQKTSSVRQTTCLGCFRVVEKDFIWNRKKIFEITFENRWIEFNRIEFPVPLLKTFDFNKITEYVFDGSKAGTKFGVFLPGVSSFVSIPIEHDD